MNDTTQPHMIQLVLRWVCASFLLAAGADHIAHPASYLSILSSDFLQHVALVFISGGLELLLGAMLFLRRVEAVGVVGTIGLLLAIFPPRLHLAVHTDSYLSANSASGWLCLPLQVLLIALAFWNERSHRSAEVATESD